MNREQQPASTLLLLACLLGGAAMLWFGLQKVGDPVAFLKAVQAYEIVPADWVRTTNFLAIWIPAIEVLGGLLLVLGFWRRGVAATLSIMLLVFTVVVLFRALEMHEAVGGAFCDLEFDCGCGTGEVFICTKLAENLFLLVCCSFAALSRRRRLWSLQSES